MFVRRYFIFSNMNQLHFHHLYHNFHLPKNIWFQVWTGFCSQHIFDDFQSGKFGFWLLWRFLPAGGKTEARTSRPAILARSSIPDWVPPQRLSSLNWFQSPVETGFGRVHARVFKRDRKWWRAAEPSDTKTQNLSSTQPWTNRQRNSVVFGGSSPFLMFSLKISLCIQIGERKFVHIYKNTRTDFLGFKHWGLHLKTLVFHGSFPHLSIPCWNVTFEEVWQHSGSEMGLCGLSGPLFPLAAGVQSYVCKKYTQIKN